jgi:spore germination cell wall hydrolase CwlJ-like protein
MISAAVMCLALNVYHEARSEPIKGQQAVAHVTLNRARERNMRVCDVVFAPAQFSWTINDPKVTDERAWAIALKVAKRAYRTGPAADPTGGANHYHATYVQPSWARSMERTTRIGLHIFYTDKPTQLARASTSTRSL